MMMMKMRMKNRDDNDRGLNADDVYNYCCYCYLNNDDDDDDQNFVHQHGMNLIDLVLMKVQVCVVAVVDPSIFCYYALAMDFFSLGGERCCFVGIK